MIILGIDPGLAATGYGVVERKHGAVQALDYGCIRTSAPQPEEVRLDHIYHELARLLQQWEPVEIAVEDVFSIPRIPRAALLLGEVRGVIMLAAARNKTPLIQISTREVKKALTGSGAAGKDQVERSVRRMLSLEEPISPNHASDALALAVVGSSRMSQK